MCSANTHPLSRARKTQALISVISWPCAVAAVFTSREGPHALIQLGIITISSIIPLLILSGYRKFGSQSYSLLEIAFDGLIALLLVGVYISGVILLSTQHISEWESVWDYTLDRGLPQIYSNLSCIILGLLYLRTFSQGFFHKGVMSMLKARSTDAPITNIQNMAVGAAGFVSTDSPRGLYTDDVESQLFPPESSLIVMDNQTTGIVTKE
ncbi:hypothetical protein N7516_008136 [Penicillium verrucosum]|uniref:MARVEL domain-containing protein n=1 Tax=Penicillium nordicum TaxID=229535 RepID=A0A0M8PAB8_9EURO|nr:uncharacterized protein N7516_008136 [Penicillium verrucosum]KAJ5926363.1 hypothetical protein N7516_008136 [Penicillium verrucosum]KOS48516.1 hypothetical protein ACN38_g471 [Penicillium nordicum]